MKVALVRDYVRSVAIAAGGEARPLAGPVGDLLIFDLEPAGNYVAIRPSGTEPKVKFYMFAYDPPGAAGRSGGDEGRPGPAARRDGGRLCASSPRRGQPLRRLPLRPGRR